MSLKRRPKQSKGSERLVTPTTLKNTHLDKQRIRLLFKLKRYVCTYYILYKLDFCRTFFFLSDKEIHPILRK